MTNAPYDAWEPFMVTNGVAYATDGTVYHREELEYTEDGHTLSNLAGDAYWEPVTGLGGQYCYCGPIMHPSEVLTEHTVHGLEDGLYQCVQVHDISDEDDDEHDAFCDGSCEMDDPTVGWALMRYVGPSN